MLNNEDLLLLMQCEGGEEMGGGGLDMDASKGCQCDFCVNLLTTYVQLFFEIKFRGMTWLNGLCCTPEVAESSSIHLYVFAAHQGLLECSHA